MANNPRPVLYYTIKREPYSSTFDVMRVTSVNGSRVYGSVNSISTHVLPRHCYGKFDSEELASARVATIRQTYEFMSDDVRSAERLLTATLDAREIAVQSALKG